MTEAMDAPSGGVSVADRLGEAELRAQRGELDAAIEGLFAVRADVADASVEIRLGDLLRKAGRPTEAAAAYRRAVKLGGETASVLRSLSAAYRDGRRPEAALATARQAVELAPDDPWILVQLGNAHAAMGSPSEAAAAYRAALDRDLHLPGVALALGEQCLAAGDSAAAAAALHLAAAETSGDGPLMLRVARIHDGLGQPGEAVPWYRRAMARGEEGAREGLAAALAARGPCRAPNVGDERLADAICRIPRLAAGEGLVCTPLGGGFQNSVWRVRGAAGDFALRLEKFPAARWDFHAEEARNAAIAHRAGIAPEIVYADEADGTMLTRFAGGRVLGYDTVGTRRRLEWAGRLYRTLHACPPFFGTYDIFGLIDGNLANIEAGNADAESGIPGLVGNLGAWRGMLDANGVPTAPCHNDPIPSNFIDTGAGIALVDWQCSGMTDPHWEIGAFSAQAGLSPQQERRFFAAYFGGGDHPGADRARLYKAVCHAFWLTRAVARKAEGEPEEHWREDMTRSGERLAAMLADPAHADLLRRVRDYRA
ncbi:MAG: phosphotransferase [Magnetospirillum sp.]|nr:phosphotransferase [Magnetospirillum sp.]